MANINICDLPDNILERVFSNIESESLRMLTEVCPRFNNVIGSSRQLMNRFPRLEWIWYDWEKLEVQPILMSERKYRRMNISDVEGIAPDLKHFLTKHATTLTKIRFYCCSFKSSEFGSALLGLAQNLSEIFMDNVGLEVDNEIVPIQFKKLTKVTFEDCDSSIFGFFAGATTVTFLNIEARSTEKETFSPFVQSLDGVKTLKIWFEALYSTLFNDLNACRFRLTILKIETEELDDDELLVSCSQEFWNFIVMQRPTLKKLRLRCLDINRLDILLALNLQELTLTGCHLTRDSNPLQENVSIKVLRLEEIDCDDRFLLCNMIEKCTRLKRIELEGIYVPFEMTISNISEDEFLFNEAATNALRFIRVNLQLKNLTVPARLSQEPEFGRAIEKMSLESLEYESDEY